MKSHTKKQCTLWFGLLAGAALLSSTLSSQAWELACYQGQNQAGSAGYYSANTVYTSAQLGGMNDKINSFLLRKGYGVVLGVNDDNIGLGKCWVAVTGDRYQNIPASLVNQISFIRVFPLWNGVTKKGIAGNMPDGGANLSWTVQAGWWYGWAPTPSVTTTASEFVPMPYHSKYWQTPPSTFQTMPVANILAYNEPDGPTSRTDPSMFIPVADAINLYHDLLASGLRMGSPVCRQDSFNPWLSDFMAICLNRQFRVDFLTAHWYGGNQPKAANGDQFLTALQNSMKNLTASCGPNMNVWLTEYNCWEWQNVHNQAITIDFINKSAAWFNGTGYMERHAFYHWGYYGPIPYVLNDPKNGYTAFLDGVNQTAISPIGTAYRDAPTTATTYGGLNNFGL